ncbi:hypothetical protein [uncultured Aquimarina sp.]|uniref:hypothetical protein n=1 Tax=uncultured Aquimarina sp. TaxID=575652 RepID=UPI00261BA336|nr:hypothetical protein [uncultured Aquimarina sp.]
MKKSIHLFNQRMFQIFHSKHDNSAEEVYKKWGELLKDLDNELLNDSDLQFNDQEKQKLKDLLDKKGINIT